MNIIEIKNKYKWHLYSIAVIAVDFVGFFIFLNGVIGRLGLFAATGFIIVSTIAIAHINNVLKHKIRYDNNFIILGDKPKINVADIKEIDIVNIENSLTLKIVEQNKHTTTYSLEFFDISEIAKFIFYCCKINTEIDADESTVEILHAYTQ